MRGRRYLVVAGAMAVLSAGAMAALRAALGPVVLPPRDPEARGWPATRHARSDVVVLVDSEVVEATADGRSPGGPDLSYGWCDLLEQEYGPVAVLGPGDIPLGALKGRRVAVVTRSAVRTSALWLPAIRLFVQEGGVLVLERPTPEWGDAFPVEMGRTTTPMRPPVRLLLPPPARNEGLEAVPWATDVAEVRWGRAREGGEGDGGGGGGGGGGGLDGDEGGATAARPLLLVAAGGREVVAAAEGRFGQGRVVLVGLDVGRQVVALKQGPGPFPGPAAGRGAGRIEEVHEAPVADLFEAAVAAFLHAGGPLPGLWRLPGAARAAVLPTCEVSGTPPGPLPASPAGTARGTVFASFPATGPGGDREAGAEGRAPVVPPAGLDVGLGWLPPWAEGHPRRPVRLLWLDLLEEPLSLREQVGLLKATFAGVTRATRLPAPPPPDEAGRTARILGASRAAFDSSSPPPSPGRTGYRHGTGLPFRVLDDNGMPLSFREVPVVLRLPAGPLPGESRARAVRVLEEATTRSHGLVTLDAGPCQSPEGAALMADPCGFLGSRCPAGMAVLGLGDLHTFLEARERTSLTSSWDGRTLVVNLEGGATAGEGVGDLAVTVPARLPEGLEAASLTLDGREARTVRVTHAGTDLLLVPVPAAGTHGLVVDYVEPEPREPPRSAPLGGRRAGGPAGWPAGPRGSDGQGRGPHP